MKNQLLFIAAIVMFAAGCKKEGENSGTGEQVLLRLNLDNGFEQKVSYRMSSENNPDVFIDENTTMTIKVDSVLNNGKDYLFFAKVDRMRMVTEMNGEGDNYDSAKKEEDMSESELSFHNELRNFYTTPLTFTLSDRGQIVKGFAFKDDAFPAEDPIDLYNMQVVFPEKAVSVGDTWENERKISITEALSSTTKSTYTLKSINDKEAVIEVTSIIGGMKGLTKDNESKGQIIVDRKTGALKSSTMEMTMEQMGGVKVVYSFNTDTL